MFCKNCGKEIDNDCKFCPSCGKENDQSKELKNENSLVCPKCKNHDFAFTEEVRFTKSIAISAISIVLYFVGAFFILAGLSRGLQEAFAGITRSSPENNIFNTSVIIGLAIIAIVFFVNACYNYALSKTSRTKVICKKCGAWWYLTQSKKTAVNSIQIEGAPKPNVQKFELTPEQMKQHEKELNEKLKTK